MPITRIVAGLAGAGLVAALAGPLSATAGETVPRAHEMAAARTAQPIQPRLIEIRAGHHPGFDRVVFDFAGGTPADVRARYVPTLIADPSGVGVRIAGNAILEVRFEATQTAPPTGPRRIAFALPNVMTVVRSGAFEAVSTYGIGLTKRTRFHVHRLPAVNRVAVDIRAAFPTALRRVYFFDRTRYLANHEPFFVPRLRPVRPVRPAHDALHRLFAGPLPLERTQGLRLLRSHATGFSHLSIRDRIARVRLEGGCSSDGSTVTIAGEIMPTLRQFRSVDWVKIYGPRGHTADPTGPSDSIPACLNP